MSNISQNRESVKLKNERKRSVSINNLHSKHPVDKNEHQSVKLLNETKKRIHPNESELMILIKGLNCYYSLAKKSKERNLILCQTSRALELISPHWSEQKVMYWFKNNKKQYLVRKSNFQNQSNIKVEFVPIFSQNALHTESQHKLYDDQNAINASSFQQEQTNFIINKLNMPNDSILEIIQNDLVFALKKGENTAKVIGSISSCSNIVIPHSIDYESVKYVVKSISQNSFKDSKSIKKVLFANDSELTTIKKNAFADSTIETLLLTSFVSQLEDGWCYNTSNLSRIAIVPKNEYFIYFDNQMILGKSDIDSDVYDILFFIRRDSKTITIPSFVKQIASYAFQYSQIEKIFIPHHVTKICEGAFDHCDQLKCVEFEKNSELQTIEQDAFPEALINTINFPLNYLNMKENILNSLNSEELAASIREIENPTFEKDNIHIIEAKGFKKIIEKDRNKFMKQATIEVKDI